MGLLSSQPSWAEKNLEERADAVNSQELAAEIKAQGWKLLGFDDVPATQFSLTDGSIRIEANASNALIYRELAEQDKAAQFLSWSWQAESLPPSKILTKINNDDRAIALYVAFEIDRSNLSLWGRISSSVASLFSGLPQGQILTYVWGNEDAIGDWFANPYIRRIGRMKVLRNATSPLNQWHDERIDLVADFTDAFGYAPIRPVYLALSADTEDSGTNSISWVRDIRLVDQSEGARPP